jgi:hypothetical protein
MEAATTYNIFNIINALNLATESLTIKDESLVLNSKDEPLTERTYDKEYSRPITHAIAEWARDFSKKTYGQQSNNVAEEIYTLKNHYTDIYNQLKAALDDHKAISDEDIIQLDKTFSTSRETMTAFISAIGAIQRNQPEEEQKAEELFIAQIISFEELFNRMEAIIEARKEAELVELLANFVKNNCNNLTEGQVGKKTSMLNIFKFKASEYTIPYDIRWDIKTNDFLIVVSELGKGQYKTAKVIVLWNNLNSNALSYLALSKQSIEETRRERMAAKEVAILTKLKGKPHVLQIHSCKTYFSVKKGHNVQALITELCEMGELENHLSTLSSKQKLQVARGILLGVTAVHNAGVVHRDIKPANIFLKKIINQHGEEEIYAVVSDFGLSCYVEMDDDIKRRAGTLSYYSPEIVFQRKPASFISDAWSVGITFFRMFYNRHPYKGLVTEQTLYTKMICGLYRTPEPMDKISVEYMIWKLLQEQPSNRMSIAGALSIIEVQLAN